MKMLTNWNWDYVADGVPALVQDSTGMQAHVQGDTLIAHDEDLDDPIAGAAVVVTNVRGDEICQVPVVVLETLIANYRAKQKS